MEPTTALAMEVPFTPAPKSTDNETVILWALGLSVICAIFAFNKLWSMMVSTQADLKAAREKCAEEYKELQDKYENILQGSNAHFADMSSKMMRITEGNNVALEKNNEALEHNTRFFQKFIDTDRYEKHK